jgi:hypothetical protein
VRERQDVAGGRYRSRSVSSAHYAVEAHSAKIGKGMGTRKRAGKETESGKLRRVPTPVRLSEDEADVIISERNIAEDPEGIPFEGVLNELGYELDRTAHPRRKASSR